VSNIDLNIQSELIAAMDELAAGGVELLRSGEWSGRRKDACRCPVSNFLTERVGVRIVVTTAFAVRYVTARGHTAKVVASVELPPSVVAFIEKFDRGEYPELVREPPVRTVLR
jgi:hypothetical protein